MKISLVVSPLNTRAKDGAFTVAAWLSSQGIAIEMIDEYRDEPNDLQNPLFADDVVRVEGSDMVVAFGGDGTTLRAARLVGYREIPIVSFNFGHLGFLSSGPGDGMIDMLTTALAGEVQPNRRATLDVEARFADGTTKSFFALNETVFGRGNSGRVIEFSWSINGVPIAHMSGDGILVATATGSTAYALSAGSPIVAPSHMGLIVTPVAPHTLSSRPVVTGPADCIEIDIDDKTIGDAALFIDGNKYENSALTNMTVRRGEADILLVHFSRNDFYKNMAESFFNRG